MKRFDVFVQIEYVEEDQKPFALMRHLNEITDGLILVFVETKRAADRLEYGLTSEGYPATSIHGDRSQGEREAALASFKAGHTPILVATDVASRGLDINNVTHVFNFDLPNDIDSYVHRIGRTGRAGNTGLAVSFMNEGNSSIARELAELLSENGQDVPTWMNSMARARGFGGRGGRGGRRGGARFGGRDFRRDNDGGGRPGGARPTRGRGGFGGRGRGRGSRGGGDMGAW